MRLSGPVPRQWYACEAARRRAAEWRDRADTARQALLAWRSYHFDWQAWLPPKWYRVARCETHVNWHHDSGTYVSAFGIYRPAYADDARRAGVPGWDEPGQRTPREQFEAALAHYRAHGGFSGWGCRGA